MAGAVEKLQLDALGAVEARGVLRGAIVIVAVGVHEIGVEIIRADAGLGFQRRAGAVIVAAGQAQRQNHRHQHKDQQNRPHAAENPALAQAADAQQGALSLHRVTLSFPAFGRGAQKPHLYP